MRYAFVTPEETFREITRTTLGVMFFLSSLGWLAASTVDHQWERTMDTAGFVDWPSLPGATLQTASFVVPIVVCLAMIGSHIARTAPAQLDWYLLAITVAAVVSWAGVISAIGHICPESAVVDRLVPQTGPVTAYNRLYCLHWCHARPEMMAMAARGECGVVTENPVFQDLVEDTFPDAQSWCRQAIATQRFELTATHEGLAPFADLKARCQVTRSRWQFLAVLCCVFNAIAGIVLVLAAIDIADVFIGSWKERAAAERERLVQGPRSMEPAANVAIKTVN